jgi:NADH-quinone oxidoreductase subunit G
VLYLRLREAVMEGTTRVVEITPAATSMTPLASATHTYRPGEAAAAAAAVAEQITEPGAVVILGRPSVAEASNFVADAARVVHERLPGVRFLSGLRRANVHGALAAGLAPQGDGMDTGAMLRAAANGRLDVLILLGSDPAVDVPDSSLAQRGLAGAGFTIAVQSSPNASTARADIVLPAAAFAERPGTTTNLEGRVTRLGQKVTAPGVAWPDWMIASELAVALGGDLGFETLEDIDAAMGLDVSAIAGDGQVVEPWVKPAASADAGAEIQLPGLDAYSLRLVAGRMLYDNGGAVSASPSLANLAQPLVLRANPRDLDRLGVTTGSQVRVSGAHANFVVSVVVDAGVPAGSAWMPVNVAVDDARSLIDASGPVTDIRIENVS